MTKTRKALRWHRTVKEPRTKTWNTIFDAIDSDLLRTIIATRIKTALSKMPDVDAVQSYLYEIPNLEKLSDDDIYKIAIDVPKSTDIRLEVIAKVKGGLNPTWTPTYILQYSIEIFVRQTLEQFWIKEGNRIIRDYRETRAPQKPVITEDDLPTAVDAPPKKELSEEEREKDTVNIRKSNRERDSNFVKEALRKDMIKHIPKTDLRYMRGKGYSVRKAKGHDAIKVTKPNGVTYFHRGHKIQLIDKGERLKYKVGSKTFPSLAEAINALG